MAHRDRRLPEPKRIQSIVEWQYQRAHRYWDDSGKVIAAVEKSFPGLLCQGLQPDGFQFTGRSKGITDARFYWDKAYIAQGGVGDSGLADAVHLFWPIVQSGLAIEKVNRLGHRSWLCYETDRLVDAVNWLRGFKFVTLASADENALGAPAAMGSVIRTTLEPGDRRLRLELNAATATIAGKEIQGVMVDVDISLEKPELSVDIREFVGWNVAFIRKTVEPMFRRR